MRRAGRLREQAGAVLALLALAIAPAATTARAQGGGVQSLPGLVVTVPPPAPPAAETPKQTAPAKPAEDQGTKARPKSDAAPRKKSAALPSDTAAEGRGSTHSIVVLVNDDPITGYEVEQRSRFLAMQASNINEKAQDAFKRLVQQDSTNERLRAILQETIQANPGKSREQILAIFEERKKEFAQSLQRRAVENVRASLLPSYRKSALEELIDERLKIQEAKRVAVLAEDAQVDEIIKGIAERNKMTPAQFAQHLKGMGADIDTMRARFRANLSWGAVIRRRFSAQVSVNQREIDRLVSATSVEGEDDVELDLQRITLPVQGKMDQKTMARLLDDADRMRRAYKGCKSTATLAKAHDAKFEALGSRKPATVAEPTRSLLVGAKDGEMVPPSVSTQGVELYAVCGRKVVKPGEKKRDQVTQELEQKEFEVLARRHLRDLRQDAHIEYR